MSSYLTIIYLKISIFSGIRERLIRESESERFTTAPSLANSNNQNVSYLTISLAFVHMCLGHASIDSACLLQSCLQFQPLKEKNPAIFMKIPSLASEDTFVSRWRYLRKPLKVSSFFTVDFCHQQWGLTEHKFVNACFCASEPNTFIL